MKNILFNKIKKFFYSSSPPKTNLGEIQLALAIQRATATKRLNDFINKEIYSLKQILKN